MAALDTHGASGSPYGDGHAASKVADAIEQTGVVFVSDAGACQAANPEGATA
jgi:hypothetical protein